MNFISARSEPAAQRSSGLDENDRCRRGCETGGCKEFPPKTRRHCRMPLRLQCIDLFFYCGVLRYPRNRRHAIAAVRAFTDMSKRLLAPIEHATFYNGGYRRFVEAVRSALCDFHVLMRV
jgi:hypothetical protein